VICTSVASSLDLRSMGFLVVQLYTLTTLVLVGQTIYYDHLMRRIQRDFPPKTQESNAFPEARKIQCQFLAYQILLYFSKEERHSN
jgi:hypothetical protein